MTLAVIFVVAATLSLVYILALTVSRKMQVFAKPRLNGQIQPIDVDAFRNLIDPAEDDYLRRRLPSAAFRTVRRERLLATADYVKAAGRNAALLVHLGQSAINSPEPQMAEAARRLVNDGLLLRRNAAFALLKIYMVLAWPNSGLIAVPVLQGYERMTGSAMLLGRLRNPAVPVRF